MDHPSKIDHTYNALPSLHEPPQSQNYNEITWDGKDASLGKIYLGTRDDSLVEKESIHTIVFLHNTSDEIAQDELNVAFQTVPVNDDILEDIDALDQGARLMHQSVSQGKNVFVEGLGERDLSAMAVATYLIAYQYETAEAAAHIVKTARLNAPLNLSLLQEYHRHCVRESERALQEESARHIQQKRSTLGHLAQSKNKLLLKRFRKKPSSQKV